MSMRGGGAPSILSTRFGAKKVKEKNSYGIKVLRKVRHEELDKSIKEVTLTLNPKKIRNMTGVKILEKVFGLQVSTSLAKRLVVAQVKENCPFAKDGFVKPGDILKSVAGESINSDNLDFCLKCFESISSVKMVFHEMLENSPLNAIDVKITSLSDILDNLNLIYGYDRPVIETEEASFSVLFIAKETLESENTNLAPTFCYPRKEKNLLYPIRGSFITLESLIISNYNEKTLMTVVKHNRNLYYVTYTCLSEGLLLLGFNSRHVTLFEVRQQAAQFLELLYFLHGPNYRIDSNNHILLQLCELKKVQLITGKTSIAQKHFENVMPQPIYVALPKEIQLRIDDAISELEAMDFCNWTDSEDVIDALREFVIVGCAVFYRTYLLATHLSGCYMVEVQNFMKHVGLHRIMDVTSVKKMVVWNQFHPKDGPQNEKKKFLVLTSQGSLALAAVLEEQIAKTGTNRTNSLKTSLSYFVEEMQDILDYFRLTGVENLTRIWISSNKRPEVLQAGTTRADSPAVPFTKDQDSDGSDSDWEEGINSGKSSSGFDMSDDDLMYKDYQEIIPSILTIGPENLLYHFVQIDVGNGVIVSPILSFQSNILNMFRQTCAVIHETLQRTQKFEQMLTSKQPAAHNRNLVTVAVKENGVMITVTAKGGKPETFWVIGRLLSNPQRELYVCHRSNMPQNMIELAFKICISGAG